MTARTVGILGGGSWGFALGAAVQTAGHHAVLCTRREGTVRKADIEVTTELAELARRARLIFIAVPSNVARAVAGALGDVTDGSHMIVHGVRGLSDEGLLPLSEIIRQETPVRRVGALGGPVVVDDLLERRPTVIVVASRFPEVLESVRDALASELLRVSETSDLTGLEWASALVGALMVGLGYANVAGIEGGLLAGLMTRGLHEATRIGVAAGADEHTFMGMAGMGDLMAAFSPRHRAEVEFGSLLAKGASTAVACEKIGVRIEAVELIPRVLTFASEHGIAVPVFHALGEVIAGRADKEKVLPVLMRPGRRR